MPPPAPSAVDILPRHLQASTGAASASSSSNASPAGTPPTSSAAGSQPSFTRSPSTGAIPLPSPSGLSSSQQGTAPGSPSGGNRFGLSLGFIQRRPRGWTTSSAQRSPATSPAGELPPSPSGNASGERGGYGFPALRRTLSKRTGSGDGSKTRQRRSSSQPPPPVGLAGDPAAVAAASGSATDVRTTAGGAVPAPAASTSAAPPPAQAAPPSPNPQFSSLTATTSLPNPSNRPRAATGSGSGDAAGEAQVQKLRLVPHLESSRSLHFDPIERDLAPFAIVRIGRFTDRSSHQPGASAAGANAQRGTATDPARVAFKSKVVSRGHAEIWADDSGKFFIRDTKSSSGTFLNHIRLSSPNVESRPSALKDGDVLQLGVDYQGGTEEIYRCVKMRVELNRGWQRGANNFNTAALAQLRALGATPDTGTPASASSASLSTPNAGATGTSSAGGTAKPATPTPDAAAAAAAAAASITDCCICLYPVTVCQALFIAPCSHVTHFKCIRPLVEQNYPGFSCPLCRTYANLEADVEIDLPEPEPVPAPPAVEEEDEEAEHLLALEGSALGLAGRSPPMAAVEEADEPASRAASIRSRPAAASRRSSLQALSHALEGAGAGARRSRPASIAPAAAEDDADDDGDAEEEERDAAAASRGGLAMPIASASHLAPPAEDLYASLANAATPPNNTFLSTLADSGALFLPQQAQQHGSIDAAVLGASGGRAGPGPSAKRGSGASGSGSGASGSTDGEGEGEGEDAETQEAHSAEEGAAEHAEARGGKGKGKAREEPVAAPATTPRPKRKSSLFDGVPVDHPDPSVAAALLI
ncbi:hypothetical protein JCM10450v2_003678 [Rhodotorula kratochvilovae]